MPAWINAGRNLRYREHESRKHGQRPDRFWCLHYSQNNRCHTEGVGWWSQGISQAYCREVLAELQKNWRTGAGPQTLKELREAGQAQAAAKITAEIEGRKKALTLGQFWNETVLPQIQLTYKKNNLIMSEARFRTWLKPFLAYPLDSIKTLDLEMKVVKPMLEAGKSPGTIESVLRLFSVIWYRAKKLELATGDCPVIHV
ncbi:MAG: hypothetical protein FWG97_03440, partial [Deltaproteobacteria bacterium]|nr:hypothetical protein [Deltaproteobacteria bacterium]